MRPFIPRSGIHYIYAKNIPWELTDHEIYDLFAGHPINHFEIHRCFQCGLEVEGHCFVGFERLFDAVYALNAGIKGDFECEMSIISAGFNIAFNH